MFQLTLLIAVQTHEAFPHCYALLIEHQTIENTSIYTVHVVMGLTNPSWVI